MDLRRMRFLMNRLPMARFRVEKAMAKATKCTAVLSDMPRGGASGDNMDRGVELLERARGSYAALIRELETMRKELEPFIALLDRPLERTVMQLRYIDGMSGREIAYQLCYSEQHIFRELAAAEKKLTALAER